jgi:hypothetical protein
MIEIIFISNKKNVKFLEGNALILKNLSMKENPYHILLFYMIFLVNRDPSINLRAMFFQSGNCLPSQIRHMILRFVLLTFIDKNKSRLKARHKARFNLFLIKHEFIYMTKSTILSYFRKKVNWKSRNRS